MAAQLPSAPTVADAASTPAPAPASRARCATDRDRDCAPLDLDTSDRSMLGVGRAMAALQSKSVAELSRALLSRHRVCAQMGLYLSRLGLDLRRLQVIHIGGTKGKGSTSAFVESIVREHGVTTGLNSSPHLVSLTERFRLNGVPIPDALFLQHFWAVWDGLVRAAPAAASAKPKPDAGCSAAGTASVAASSRDATVPAAAAEEEDVPPIPSHFRFLTLVAYHLFLSGPAITNHAVPECIVLEVGLGGKLDATNIVAAPMAVGLSSIGFDHMEVLGYTLPEIAREKAGIIKPGVAAFSTDHQTKEVKEVLSAAAEHERASLQFVPALSATGENAGLRLGLAGAHQFENAGLACALAHQFLTTQARLHPADDRFAAYRAGAAHATLDLSNLPAAFRAGLEKTCWPGRCQRLAHPSRALADRISFFIDGAHTDASMRVATAWFQEEDARERALAAQAGSAPSAPARYILLFNCGHVRDPIELMLPLVALQYPNLAIGAAASAAAAAPASSCAATAAAAAAPIAAPAEPARACAECGESAVVFCSDCFRCLCARHNAALHPPAAADAVSAPSAHARHRLRGVSFSHLVCAPFDHDRPHFSAAPNFEKLLRNYLLPAQKRSNLAVAQAGAGEATIPAAAAASASISAPQINPLLLRYLCARFDFPADGPSSAASASSSSAAYVAAAEASIARIMQDCPAVEPTSFSMLAAAAAGSASVPSPSPSPPPPQSQSPLSPSDHSGSWQRTLFRVWRFLQQALAHEEARVSGAESGPGAGAESSPSQCVFAPSVARALQGIQQLAEQEPRQSIQCLVTGSLYIVGNVLDKLHYQV